MLKICDESVCKPLAVIFRSCLENGKFPSEWKKVNVVPVFKKNNKQKLKNHRPISLLPDSGKIFERLLYDCMFKSFTEKVWHKVWHKGLIFKLKQNGILKTFTDFLKLRKQRVVLNGQLSSWSNIEKSVTQGPILGPLLFLIYINDLSDGPATNTKLFADDVSLFFCG